MKLNKEKLKRLFFFWIMSSLCATGGFYLLRLIFPEYNFIALYRMFLYHHKHPIQYMIIPCFFYGIIAASFSDWFFRKKRRNQLGITVLIITLTISISSPFGGMLWVFHDMQAGWFPENWFNIILSDGASMGLGIGWFIPFFSIPYSLLGSVVCYSLTKKGSELFRH